MKVEIEITDLDLALSALSQAIYCYGQVNSAAFFGCDIPHTFLNLFQKLGLENPEDRGAYLQERVDLLKNMYSQLEIIEKSLYEK